MAEIPEQFERRLKNCTNFPSPPAVAMRVIELARDPDIDLTSVADAVSADPAIAAKVMRIANSALYARRRQSENLRQALIVLGLNATLTLALSFTLVETLSGEGEDDDGFDVNAYWRRALLAATWGKLLANEFGRRDAEEVFLAALLQDIGMLAINKVAPEVYDGISPFKLDHNSLVQHEKSFLGTDHRAIGAWLLKDWNMPEYLCRAVQHSHDLSAAGIDPEHREFVRAVAMSGELSDIWLTQQDEIGIRRAGMDAHRHLGILPNRLAELFTTVQEQIPVAENIFSMDLFDEAQVRGITETAREILMIRNLHALSEVADLQKRATKLADENEELKEESSRDGLTGVFNRRHFEEALEQEFKSASRHEWPLSIIFVDLDRFKHINDTFGHQIGDAMLREVTQLLTSNLRETDVVGRYGGDEFVLLLPGIDEQEAEVISGRLVEQARGRSVTAPAGQCISITLSLGTATFDSGDKFETAKSLLAAADEALYHSKRNGRDRHTCYHTIQAA